MFEQTFKNIDDILHKDAGCTSELDYTEQSSWLLFLKYRIRSGRSVSAFATPASPSFASISVYVCPLSVVRVAQATLAGRHPTTLNDGGLCGHSQRRALNMTKVGIPQLFRRMGSHGKFAVVAQRIIRPPGPGARS